MSHLRRAKPTDLPARNAATPSQRPTAGRPVARLVPKHGSSQHGDSGTGERLQGKRILIVEDEYLLAMDLADYFIRMGARVLGPAASVEEARKQVDRAEAAVLDIDLRGESVFPIADQLANRGIPFVFFTGHQDLRLPERFRHAGFLSKPANWDAVWSRLFPGEAAIGAASGDDVARVLPKLRLSARLIMHDPAAADRLLELALEKALAEVHLRPVDATLEAWLGAMLEDVSRRYGPDLMH